MRRRNGLQSLTQRLQDTSTETVSSTRTMENVVLQTVMWLTPIAPKSVSLLGNVTPEALRRWKIAVGTGNGRHQTSRQLPQNNHLLCLARQAISIATPAGTNHHLLGRRSVGRTAVVVKMAVYTAKSARLHLHVKAATPTLHLLKRSPRVGRTQGMTSRFRVATRDGRRSLASVAVRAPGSTRPSTQHHVKPTASERCSQHGTNSIHRRFWAYHSLSSIELCKERSLALCGHQQRPHEYVQSRQRMSQHQHFRGSRCATRVGGI